MLRKIALAAALILVAAAAHAGSPAKAAPAGHPAPAPRASTDGWPATRVGEMAGGWVKAFSSGETEMRNFLATNMAGKSLEEKPMPQRVERYKNLREKYGKLALVSVVEESSDEITVKLSDSSAELHEFIFKIQKEAPYKLLTVSIKQPGHSFGGFHH